MSIEALAFSHFDPAVRPNDDLFRHVNGAWLASARIPDDRSSWGAFYELREAAERAVREIVEEQTTDGPDPDAARIANLYTSFMAVDEVNRTGIAPLRPLLARIDRIATLADLASFWGWSMRHGIDTPVSFGNDADPGNPKHHAVFVAQSGIGLPDEEYYRLPEHAEIRDHYRKHMARMLELGGVAEAGPQAELAFELETRIAARHWDKVRTRDMVEMYHPQTWAEFTADAPAIDWAAILAGAELPIEAVSRVINMQHTFCAGLAELVTEELLPAWRAWARWQLVDALAPWLPDELVEEHFDFYGRRLQGIPELRERWKRGVALVEEVLGEAVGRNYVARYFPPQTKRRADELVANLLTAYRESIAQLDWMTDQTRAEALDKLAKLRAKIGYPDKWRDYSRLEVHPDDLLGNVLRADSFEFDHMIEQLSEPIDPDEWLMYPQSVNAYYHPLRNEIVFPAAILQPPFFNPDADDAVNYGAIGAVIGHEIGHGFDDQGSTCDGEGRLRNWWTEADKAAFEQRTAALVAQYGALAPSAVPDVKVNGELTLGENIGDLGGLAIAYQAWLLATERAGRPAEPVDGIPAAQRFFFGWAAAWRGLTRPEALRERLATDPHSPDEIRCNQTARNVAAFHTAFDTSPGDALWLDPAERVRIW